MAVSDNRATRSTGPGGGAHGQQRHHRLPNFARNLSWSFFDTPQKRCNSNDANSMFEQAAGELRAKLMGGGGARPGIETTHRATRQHTRSHRCEGRRRAVRGLAAVPVGGGGAWPVFEATRRAKLAARTARGRAAAHGHTKQPGPTAGPSGARNTSGATNKALRAGRRPRAHKAARPTSGVTSNPRTPRRHNKTARPQWGRAAVAVALGFEPRVAVTPHSISSAAPSAARTRYLTRILYYTDPRSAQIDRAGWDQGHTTSQDHTAARNMGATSALRTVENKIK